MSTNKYFYNKMIETEHTTASYPLDQTKGIKQVMLYNNPVDALEAIPNAADTTESEEDTVLVTKEDDDERTELCPAAAEKEGDDEERELRPAAASEQSTTSESSLSTSSGKARHSGGNGNKPIPNAKIAQSVAAPLAGTAIADKEKSNTSIPYRGFFGSYNISTSISALPTAIQKIGDEEPWLIEFLKEVHVLQDEINPKERIILTELRADVPYDTNPNIELYIHLFGN
jgi:hypothetical protein